MLFSFLSFSPLTDFDGNDASNFGVYMLSWALLNLDKIGSIIAIVKRFQTTTHICVQLNSKFKSTNTPLNNTNMFIFQTTNYGALTSDVKIKHENTLTSSCLAYQSQAGSFVVRANSPWQSILRSVRYFRLVWRNCGGLNKHKKISMYECEVWIYTWAKNINNIYDSTEQTLCFVMAAKSG